MLPSDIEIFVGFLENPDKKPWNSLIMQVHRLTLTEFCTFLLTSGKEKILCLHIQNYHDIKERCFRLDETRRQSYL